MTTAIANWSQCIIEASVKSSTRILSFEDGEFLRSCDGATAIFKSVIGKDSHASLAFRKGPAQLMEGLFEVFDEALALSELEIIRKRRENLEQYRGRPLLISSEPTKARAVIFVEATARVFYG